MAFSVLSLDLIAIALDLVAQNSDLVNTGLRQNLGLKIIQTYYVGVLSWQQRNRLQQLKSFPREISQLKTVFSLFGRQKVTDPFSDLLRWRKCHNFVGGTPAT